MTTATTKLRRGQEHLTQAARDDGLRGAAVMAGRLAIAGLLMGPRHLGDVLVDTWIGGRTRGILRNDTFTQKQSALGDNNWYEPVRVHKFRGLLGTVDLDRPSSTFLDLGCGLGRAMLLAANAGFGRVVGVELDAGLAAAAEDNVRRWKARRRGRTDLVVLRQDAVEVDIPAGPVLVFVYNSFGPATLGTVLDRMVASHRADPRPMWLCYVNAQHADHIESRHAELMPRARRKDWVVYSVATGHSG